MSSFLTALETVISPSFIASKDGMSYISAATAVREAGMPQIKFVDWQDSPHFTMFNNAVVAVEIPLTQGDQTIIQRTYLPIMDAKNNAMPANEISITDINNSRQRCLVKAIATTLGNGMSLFLGTDGDGKKASKVLNLTPDSNLALVEPVVSKIKGGSTYLAWNHALAAARITDPLFHWDVVTWDNKPFRLAANGILIDITTTYKGTTQVLSLPVMDDAHNPLTPDRMNLFMWNRTVMRALAKAIAFHTGYGLNLYAKEFDLGEEVEAPVASTPAKENSTEKGSSQAKSSSAKPKEEAAKAQAPVAKAEAPKVEDPKVESAKTEEPTTAENASTEAATTTAQEKAPQEAAQATQAAAKEDSTKAQFPESTPFDPVETEAKFKSVMTSRWNKVENGKPMHIDGLTTLFDALRVSKVYTEDQKPFCFGILISGLVSALTPESVFDLPTLLEKLKVHNPLDYVAPDSVELVKAKMVGSFIPRALALGDSVLHDLPFALSEAGIVDSIEEFVAIAQQEGVSSETIDLILDAELLV